MKKGGQNMRRAGKPCFAPDSLLYLKKNRCGATKRGSGMKLDYVWTDGSDDTFRKFYLITEAYYSSLVGGEENRRGFIPYNASSAVENVLIVFSDGVPAACAGLKRYSEKDAEIKRVWVEPAFRGRHIAAEMMRRLEEKAKTQGYERMILQTRERMKDAVHLYIGQGYQRIANYPPYDHLDGAVCLAKAL